MKTKRGRGRTRQLSRKLTSQSMAPALNSPEAPERLSASQYDPLSSIADEFSMPLEMLIEVDIKQEPFSSDTEEQSWHPDEVKVEMGLLAPESLGPIMQGGCRSLAESNGENVYKDRCQFCFKLFRENGGRGNVTKLKIEFVLGLSQWDSTKCPGCCEKCRKMFDMFYKFKRNCLEALARPVELFIGSGNKNSRRAAVLKPKDTTMSKSVQQVKIRENERMEDSHISGFDSERESSGKDIVNTETSTIEDVKDIEQVDCVVGVALEPYCPVQTKKSKTRKPRKKKKQDQNATEQHDPAETNESNTIKDEPDGDRKTRCGYCWIWLPNEDAYLQHQASCGGARKCKRVPHIYACAVCPKKFPSTRELQYHTNKHNDVRTIQCRKEGCTKMFYHPAIRNSHEKICNREIQAICNVCGCNFRSKPALSRHLVTHGDPQFKCDTCDKRFFSKIRLLKHFPVHTNERNYGCKICGKRFKTSEANHVHKRTHTNEAPYACHLCDQRFKYSNLLKIHMEKGHEASE